MHRIKRETCRCASQKTCLDSPKWRHTRLAFTTKYAHLPFLLEKIKKIGSVVGTNGAVHPDGPLTTPRAALRRSPVHHHLTPPYAGHHLTPPLRKSLKKTVREVVHIVPVDGEGEESSRYLEAGKGGECLWPLLPTQQI
jgi:hypothetical protein